METKRELKRLKAKFKRVLQALVSWSSGQAVSINAPTPTNGTHTLIKRYSTSHSNLKFLQELLIVSMCFFKFMLSFHFIISPQRQTQYPMLGLLAQDRGKPVISFMSLSLPFSPISLVETHKMGFCILIEKICESKTKAVTKYVMRSFALGRLSVMTGKVPLRLHVLTRFRIQKSEIEVTVSPMALPDHRFFFLIINLSKGWQS